MSQAQSKAQKPPSALNPVAQVTVDLAEQVDEEFSQVEDKTLLILDYDLEQRDVVSGYISVLNATADLSSDLNIVLKTPFRQPAGFSAALGTELVQGLKDQEQEFFETFGAYPKFKKAVIEAEPMERRLLLMCAELAEQVANIYDHVTLVLIPETGFNQKFSKWLERLEPFWTDPKVQIMTTECREHPGLGKLPDSFIDRTHRLKIEVDMDEVMMETFDQAAAEIGPEADYQKAIMNALQGIKKQEYAKSRAHAETAFTIAQENAWPTMQVMALIYYGASVPHVQKEESIRAADQALDILAKEDPEADPSIPKLQYQALMMKGQAYLTHKEFAAAAPAYEEAYGFSEAMKNPLQKLETARMASFCHYHGGDQEKAWEWGNMALTAVEDMPAEVVPTTTFPFLITHLDEVRLRGSYEESEKRTVRLETYMRRLMGEDWRPQIKEMVRV